MFQTTLLTSLSLQNGGRVDYEDLLNQKRRDEARYRYGGQSGGFQQANLRSPARGNEGAEAGSLGLMCSMLRRHLRPEARGD